MKKLLRIILLLVNLLFAAALLLSTLAGVIPPSKSSAISLLSYGYPFLLAANIVWVAGWLCFSRKEFLVSLIAILLRCNFIPMFFQLGGNTEWLGNDTAQANVRVNAMKIMTFNVHGFHGVDDSLSPDEGAKMFFALLREEQPDVLTLQEFFDGKKVVVADTLETMGYRYHYGFKDRSYGLQLYSKYPFDYVCSLDGSNKLYADIVKGGKVVRLFCVHLDSYQLTHDETGNISKLISEDTLSVNVAKKLISTFREHENEWDEVLKKQILESPHPFIVAGDFNDTPASYIYQQLGKYAKDSYVEQGCGFCTTYHGMFPAYRIDHVFHSDTLQALSYKRVRSDISDHYPVVVTLKL